MFLEYYHLHEQPFGVTPDPRYLYPSLAHREALASLVYAFESELGFASLIAEPGLGKTTLLYSLLERFGPSTRNAYIFETQCDPKGLLRHILSDLDWAVPDTEINAMFRGFRDLVLHEANTGRRVLIIIDEAQNLGEPVLETVRLLSNFETSGAKLVHIVLAGQPQLAQILARPEMAQLRQRITIPARLRPFSASEVAEYIAHRLRVAGYSGRSLFTPEALALIAEQSRGIPREINRICFNAMSLGFALERNSIDSDLVQEAGADLDLGPVLAASTSDVFAPAPSQDTAPAPPEIREQAAAPRAPLPFTPRVARQPAVTTAAAPPAGPRGGGIPSVLASAPAQAPAALPALAEAPVAAPAVRPVPVAPFPHAHTASAEERQPIPFQQYEESQPATRRKYVMVGAAALGLALGVALFLAERSPELLSRSAPKSPPSRTAAPATGPEASSEPKPGANGRAAAERRANLKKRGVAPVTHIADRLRSIPGQENVPSSTEPSPSSAPATAEHSAADVSPRVTSATISPNTPALPASESVGASAAATNNGGNSPEPGTNSNNPEPGTNSNNKETNPAPAATNAATAPSPSASNPSPSTGTIPSPVNPSASTSDAASTSADTSVTSADVNPSATARPAPTSEPRQISPGRLLTRVEPRYPAAAREAHIQGSVVLTAHIGKDGRIADVHVVKGNSLLTTPAADAVRKWVYTPFTLNGQAVEVNTTIVVNFSL